MALRKGPDREPGLQNWQHREGWPPHPVHVNGVGERLPGGVDIYYVQPSNKTRHLGSVWPYGGPDGHTPEVAIGVTVHEDGWQSHKKQTEDHIRDRRSQIEGKPYRP